MENLRLPGLVLALAAGLSACSYDLDPLFEHELGDGGLLVGGDAGGQVSLASQALIGAWIGHSPLVDQDCIACAEQKCGDAETSCRGDAECVEFTNCVGASPDPAGQAACRAAHTAWVRSDVRARDLTGPYGQCVFKYSCPAECGGNDDLWCVGKFSWPQTPAATVPLHLYLADALMQTESVPGVKVKVCAGTDLPCATPTAEATTDAAGMVDLALPTSFAGAFTGYLQIEGGKLYPTLLKFSWNVGQETTYLLNTVNKDLFNQSINLIGLKPDDKRGMLQLRMLGCGSVGTRGVSFKSDRQDPQSVTWYIDGLPKIELTATGVVGSGGIIDMPEGNTSVTATRASDNTLVGRIDAPVRAGFMTVVIFEPAPQ